MKRSTFAMATPVKRRTWYDTKCNNETTGFESDRPVFV